MDQTSQSSIDEEMSELSQTLIDKLYSQVVKRNTAVKKKSTMKKSVTSKNPGSVGKPGSSGAAKERKKSGVREGIEVNLPKG
jgi:hypothetical protein